VGLTWVVTTREPWPPLGLKVLGTGASMVMVPKETWLERLPDRSLDDAGVGRINTPPHSLLVSVGTS
jgi:hypothetical protein